jgi:hypothetical protein
MRKLVLLLMGVMFFSGISYAQNIGPSVPPKNQQGDVTSFNLGAGYNYHQADYDGVDIEQNQAYAHIGIVRSDLGMPDYEIYVRLGGATLEDDDDNFDGGTETMYAAGLRSVFYQGETFGWGGVLQGLYVDEFKDSVKVDDQKIDVSLEDSWEVEVAFPIHARIINGLVYFGPVFYSATTDVTSSNFQDEGDLDEDNNLGAFGGAALRFNNFSIELEAKYRSDLSAGALVTFAF